MKKPKSALSSLHLAGHPSGLPGQSWWLLARPKRSAWHCRHRPMLPCGSPGTFFPYSVSWIVTTAFRHCFTIANLHRLQVRCDGCPLLSQWRRSEPGHPGVSRGRIVGPLAVTF